MNALKNPGETQPKGEMTKHVKEDVKLKMLIQQCLSATLNINDSDGNPSQIKIDRGIVVYICFLKGCEFQLIEKAVNILLKIKLSENEDNKLVSIADINGDILIVPQASLGGKLKGSSIQYHNNTSKDDGLNLFQHFIQTLKSSKCKIQNGIYGQRQILQMATNGPFAHILEL